MSDGRAAGSICRGRTAMSQVRSIPRCDNVYPGRRAGRAGAGRARQGPDAGSWAGLKQSTHNSFDDDFNLEAIAASDMSLADHLGEQLQLAVTDPIERLIGQHLIDMIDEAGYLRADVDELAEKLGCPR